MKHLLLLLLLGFVNCTNQKKVIAIHYYQASNEGKIVRFQERRYEYIQDTIIEKVVSFNVNKNLFQQETQTTFIKVKNGLNIIINKKEQPYLRFNKDTCVKYNHPLVNEVENCFINFVNYRGYKNSIEYSYSENIVDGLLMTIHLDRNFTLIDKKIIGFGNYDELIRINKDSIPPEIKKSF